MITLTAKIEIGDPSISFLNSVSINNSGNNISSAIGDILGVRQQGSNPFIIGSNTLGDGSTFSSGEKYFIGTELSNSEGVFETPYVLTIKGKNINQLNIIFDEYNGNYPKEVTITQNGESFSYSESDALYSIGGLTAEDEQEIVITIPNWSSPNAPLKIQGIYMSLSIDVNRRNIISISRDITDRSDLKFPSWGIISNAGNIEFNDIDGNILYYAEAGLLKSGADVKILLNNTLVEGAIEEIGNFKTDTWNYDNDSKVVSVSLKDDLEEWQDINVRAIDYDPRVIESKPFRWLYDYLWDITSNRNYQGKLGVGNYNMLAFEELDEGTQEVLNNSYIEYPLLESGSLWQQWTKLCQVCQLHIYKNNDGIVVCRYNGGN